MNTSMVCSGLVFGQLLASGPAWPQKGFQVTDQPVWVEDHPLGPIPTPPVDEIRSGSYYVLYESQVNALIDPSEKFIRTVVHIINEEGVQDESQFSVVFDPSYEELLLHSVRVHRDGTGTERLDPARIEVLQRETRLEYQIYDGTHTALMFLDDIRVGDLIEARYTIVGRNPAYLGRFSSTVPVRGEYLLPTLRYRLLWPEYHPLHVKKHNTNLEPEIRVFPAGTEYRVTVTDSRPMEAESYLPSWFDPYSWIQFSDFKSWEEVVAWGLELYPLDSAPPPSVCQKAREIMASHPAVEDRVMAAIQFVQDEIRYLAIELGTSSHLPASPALVLKRRFGDCKDKSVLLVSLLDAMEIPAAPALVNSVCGKGVLHWLPTPGAFNHVITRIELDGRFVWADPTDRYRRGDLAGLEVPNYGLALVIDRGEKTLSRVKVGPKARPITRIEKVYKASDPDEPVSLKIVTTMEGDEADSFRNYLKTLGMKSLRESYVDYYASMYPGIEMMDDLVVDDDERKNRIITTESYTISGFWELSSDETIYTASFLPDEMIGRLSRPTETPRTMPIGIRHPQHMVCTMRISLPEGIRIEPDAVEIKNAAFSFVYSAQYASRSLTLNYELQTLADHVAADEAEAYLADIDRIDEVLGYEIVSPAGALVGGFAGFNLSVNLVVVLVVVSATWLAVRYYRKLLVSGAGSPTVSENRPSVCATLASKEATNGKDSCLSIPHPRQERTGLGGWLILLTIGIASTPFFLAYHFVATLPGLSLNNWVPLTTPGSALYDPLFAPTLIFETCALAVRAIGSTLMAVLYFQKRRSFPSFYLLFMVFSLVVIVIDNILVSQISGVAQEDIAGGMHEASSTFIGLLIWSSYLQCSRRARATFVR